MEASAIVAHARAPGAGGHAGAARAKGRRNRGWLAPISRTHARGCYGQAASAAWAPCRSPSPLPCAAHSCLAHCRRVFFLHTNPTLLSINSVGIPVLNLAKGNLVHSVLGVSYFTVHPSNGPSRRGRVKSHGARLGFFHQQTKGSRAGLVERQHLDVDPHRDCTASHEAGGLCQPAGWENLWQPFPWS